MVVSVLWQWGILKLRYVHFLKTQCNCTLNRVQYSTNITYTHWETKKFMWLTFIVIFTLLWQSGTKSVISLRYAYIRFMFWESYMENLLLRLNDKYNYMLKKEKKRTVICDLKNGANTKENQFLAGLLHI